MPSQPTRTMVKLRLVPNPITTQPQVELLTLTIDARVQRVMEHMQEQLSQSLTLPLMAQWAQISPRQLERLFRAATGESPLQYLKQLRLAQACELLRTSFVNLKTIRAAVGMPDAAHFQHDFKAKYGMSPKQWQRMIWQQSDRQKSVHVVFRH